MHALGGLFASGHSCAAWLLFSVALVVCSARVHGQIFDGLSEGRLGSLELKGIRIPLGSDASKPTVRLEIGKVGLERARVGVFRVGLLPQPVFHDVRIHVLGGQGDVDWAGDLRTFLQGERTFNRAHISGLTVVNALRVLKIQAKEASIRSGAGRIDLRGVALEAGSAGRGDYSTAVLWLAGSKAGLLELPGGDNRTIPITDCQPSPP
jgi:hypothetical protein